MFSHAPRTMAAFAVAALTWDFAAAASVAGLGGVMEDGGDLLDTVELSRGDVHHQVVGGVVGERQAASVERQYPRRSPARLDRL